MASAECMLLLGDNFNKSGISCEMAAKLNRENQEVLYTRVGQYGFFKTVQH